MPCPHCGGDLEQAGPGAVRCPHCGRSLQRETVAVAKTATVRVAEGDRERVYLSISDIPPDVRRKIQKAIHGPNADTVIITNPEGREKISEAIRELPPRVRRQVLAALGTPQQENRHLWLRARIWVLLVLAVFVLIFLWWIWMR